MLLKEPKPCAPLTATWPLKEAGFCLQLLGEDAKMVPKGLYLLIPGDVHSPRLHPQTPISWLIFQLRQTEGAKGCLFPVISITFRVSN